MNSLSADTTTQYIIWGLGIIELVLAFYVVSLNYRRTENLHIGALFGLFAINSLATGWLIGAQNATQGNLPAAILSASTPIFSLALFITAAVLIKKEWMQARRRWFWWLLYVITLIPAILTIIDWFAGTQIWFAGLEPATYTGGFVSIANYTSSSIAPFRTLILIIVPLLTLLPLGYLAFRDRELTASKRRLARILFFTLLVVIITQALRSVLGTLVTSVLASLAYFSAYTYANFSEIVLGRNIQGGRLQPRLTALILSTTIPLLIGGIVFAGIQTNDLLREAARDQLAAVSTTLGSNVNTWLELNVTALEELVTLPAITSNDPARQKPALVTMDQAYEHMYLISTTDTKGMNVARSDQANLTDYSDRAWYQQAISGNPLTFQTLVGRTSGEPALVASMPIKDSTGQIIGVGMFASDVNDISEQIRLSQFSDNAVVFVIDADNRVVAHTNPAIANQLTDLTDDPVVSKFRNAAASSTTIQFFDQNDNQWLAHAVEIDYGWGVIIEMREAEILGTARTIQVRTGIVLGASILILAVLVALTIRQAIGPIETLTETATAIADGDYSRIAPVESQDEIGYLAETFNRMTERLLEAISGLELRVAARTRNLQERTNQLQAATEVGQAAFSILDVNQLMQEVVELIRDRFELYYVGLFLVAEQPEWAVLQAGTGTAGQAMLARQHRIRVGEGMIGWSIANAQARIALEASEDAYRLATEDLPETRSEAAIPLRSRGRVIGAFTVQSSSPGAFDQPLIAILQTMADMVGVAIDNARLYTESEQALDATRRAYGDVSQRAWREILEHQSEKISFRSDPSGVMSIQQSWSPEMQKAWQAGKTVFSHNEARGIYTITVPVKVRDNVIGVINTHKSAQAGRWTQSEIQMVETIVEQLGVAIDSARLYQETQMRAESERLLGEVATRMRETLDIQAVIRTAAQELRNALSLSEVEIRMGNDKQ